MEHKLLGNRVLIEVNESETKTVGGLILHVDNDPGSQQLGTVVAVGTGKVTETENGFIRETPVHVGDRVLFEYGKDVMVDGKHYLLVSGDDVIMVMKV